MEEQMLTPESIMVVRMIGRAVLVGSILTLAWLAYMMHQDKWH